ncbi:MAG TPA: hypothetical protein VLU95_08915 [Candidatus Acidoferrum sp.]|nr:hypothetical protein [Candidatus Acidoferrum sp.]
MNKGKKSKKLLLVATALTILAIGSVISVYAAVILGTYNGGQVIIGGVGTGTITYNETNSAEATWNTTLTSVTVTNPWYARLEIASANTFSGPVTITWQLQIETTPGAWSNVGSSVTTTLTLTTGAQIVYASTNGLIAENTDWSTLATNAGSYRITATVNSV